MWYNLMTANIYITAYGSTQFVCRIVWTIINLFSCNKLLAYSFHSFVVILLLDGGWVVSVVLLKFVGFLCQEGMKKCLNFDTGVALCMEILWFVVWTIFFLVWLVVFANMLYCFCPLPRDEFIGLFC